MDSNDQDLMLVRDILAREIETINNYQRLLNEAMSSEVAAFLRHIIEEEKEHVAEALDLIRTMDSTQAALLETGGHWREAMTRQKSEAGPNAETEHQTSSRIGLLTVGSLRQS